MADIQGTSLHYFIYMSIVQASSVSTTICIDHHVFMVSCLSKINYFATLVLFHFSDGKNKPIKRTELFIPPIKNLRANIYLTCYRCFRSSSLHSSEKLFKKLFILL